MTLDQIFIYRITHIDNVPHILRHGITHRDSPEANPHYVNIGDMSLIGARKTRSVRVDNGDYTMRNAPRIILGDFIPFYFGVRMPMLFVAQKGGNFVERATPATDIVYIACSLMAIADTGMEVFFSDGHATDGLTHFYDRSRLKDLPRLIDWDAVRAKYWGGDENLDTKRKKQAEFLVKENVHPILVMRFGCYDTEAKHRLLAMGVNDEQVRLIPNAYY